MINSNFTLAKGTALAVGNALRHYVMSQVEAWRPVAFTLNREMNMLHSSDDIPTDLTQVMAKISELDFLPTGEVSGDFYKVKVTGRKELKVSDVIDPNFTIKGAESSLLISLSESDVELTIVLRRSFGVMTREENIEFLSEHGEDEKEFSIFNSRHTDVSVCTFDVKPAGLDSEELSFNLQSKLGNEKEILASGIEFFQKTLAEMKQQV